MSGRINAVGQAKEFSIENQSTAQGRHPVTTTALYCAAGMVVDCIGYSGRLGVLQCKSSGIKTSARGTLPTLALICHLNVGEAQRQAAR